jgi:hypothetical protein
MCKFINYTTNYFSNIRNLSQCSLYDYESICKEIKTCHELIDNINPVKLYYDIEFDASKCKSKINEFKDTTNELIELLKSRLDKRNNKGDDE